MVGADRLRVAIHQEPVEANGLRMVALRRGLRGHRHGELRRRRLRLLMLQAVACGGFGRQPTPHGHGLVDPAGCQEDVHERVIEPRRIDGAASPRPSNLRQGCPYDLLGLVEPAGGGEDCGQRDRRTVRQAIGATSGPPRHLERLPGPPFGRCMIPLAAQALGDGRRGGQGDGIIGAKLFRHGVDRLRGESLGLVPFSCQSQGHGQVADRGQHGLVIGHQQFPLQGEPAAAERLGTGKIAPLHAATGEVGEDMGRRLRPQGPLGKLPG